MPSFPLDGAPLVTPERLPVLPLRDVVLFPYVVMPLLVGRQASLAAIEAANDEERLVLLVAQRDPETQEPAAADLYRVGVVARVRQLSRLGTGTVKLLVEGLRRAGPNPTRQKFMAALEGMSNVDLGGLSVGFSPTQHAGSTFVELTMIGSNGKIVR